jgi:disulfide bond formation protein DsbB
VTDELSTTAAPRALVTRANLAALAWAQALVATLGSLYFSEVMALPPCVLCWYQRIAMYPLVVILAVGILLREPRLRLYALPLSLAGLAISIYHNLLYYGVIPESIQPCTTGVSCTTRQIEWLGFITIPLLALVAFGVISAALLRHQPEEIHGEDES